MTSTPSPRSLSAEMREVSTLSRRDALGNCRAIATILDRWAESVAALEQEKALHIQMLAACYRLAGADTDGDEEWRYAGHAVDAVEHLRQDYDEQSASLAQREAEIAELRGYLRHKCPRCSPPVVMPTRTGWVCLDCGHEWTAG